MLWTGSLKTWSVGTKRALCLSYFVVCRLLGTMSRRTIRVLAIPHEDGRDH